MFDRAQLDRAQLDKVQLDKAQLDKVVRLAYVGEEPLQADQYELAVRDPQAGATVVFAGVVRNHDHDRGVSRLDYEGHPDSLRFLEELLADWVRDRPRIIAIAVGHRTGELHIGDVAFVTAVCAAHRGDAFSGCADLVDLVKAELPIWKHQFFIDGTEEWVNSP